jgi:hypothetical protein
VLGAEQNNDINIINNNESWSVNTHTAIAILVWKILPSVTWSDKTNEGKTFYLGLGSGYIFWQPQCLIFKNVDFKIGFFCLEHRTWEIIPKLLQAYMFNFKLKEIKDSYRDFFGGVVSWPLAFSFVTIKWKCLIINWLSFFELFWGFIRSCDEIEKKDGVSDWAVNPFFSMDAFKNANWKHYLLLGLFPRLTIDMSYFSNEEEERDEEEKPIDV